MSQETYPNDPIRRLAASGMLGFLPYPGYALTLPFKSPGLYRSNTTTSVTFLGLTGASFIRAGVKAKFGSDGLYYTAAANQPLITNEGLWIEGAVTPYTAASLDQLSNWGLSAGLSRTTGKPDPLGGTTARDYTSTNGIQSYYIYSIQPLSLNTTYTRVAIVAPQAGNSIYVMQQTLGVGNKVATFDLLNGTITSQPASPAVATLLPLQGGYFQAALTFTTEASGSDFTPYGFIGSAGASPGVNTVRVWNDQILSGVSTDVVITNGAYPVTPLDNARVTGPTYTEEDSILYMSVTVPNLTPAQRNLVTVSASGNNSYIGFYLPSGTNPLALIVNFNGTVVSNSQVGPAMTTGRLAFALIRRNNNFILIRKSPTGSIDISSEIPAAFLPGMLPMNFYDTGSQAGSSTAIVNLPVEFIEYRKGTFTNAEGTALVNSLAPTPDIFLGGAVYAYFDAARTDKMTLVSGSQVSAWTDLGIGGTFTQSFSGQRPLWAATSFGGVSPGVTWDGVDDYLEKVPNPYPTTTGIEIWVLMDQQQLYTDTTIRRILAMGSVNANSRYLTAIGDGISAVLASINAGTAGAAKIGFFGRHVVRAIIETDGVTISIDGLSSSKILGNTAADNIRVRMGSAAGTSPGGYAKGVLALLLMTPLLTVAQAAQTMDYFTMRKGT